MSFPSRGSLARTVPGPGLPRGSRRCGIVWALCGEPWAESTGAGLRALLGSEADLDEACLTSNLGLLASDPVTPDQLRRVGERLLADAIEPTEESARRASGGA